jgi:hypothetical protein
MRTTVEESGVVSTEPGAAGRLCGDREAAGAADSAVAAGGRPREEAVSMRSKYRTRCLKAIIARSFVVRSSGGDQ